MTPFSDYLPDWLPQDPQKNEAVRAGLLHFGAALLNGRGNLGGILGNGLLSGAQGYGADLQAQQAAADAKQKQALQAAQTTQVGLETKKLQNELDEPEQLRKIIAGPTSSPAPPAISAPTAAQGLISNAPPQAYQPVAQGPFDQSQPIPQDDPGADPSQGTPMQQMPAQAAAPAAITPPAIMPVTALPTVGSKPPVAATSQADQFQRAMTIADRLSNAGRTKDAKVYYEIADKLKPKYSTEFRVAKGDDGKLHNYLVAEDGTYKDAGLGVKPEMVESDLGGTKIWKDKNSLTDGQTFTKTVTPGENLQHSDQVATRAQADRHWKAEQENGGEVPITPEAIANAAARYNFDGTLPPMGMGKAAAAGRSAILNKAAELKTGIDPEQQRRDQLGNKNDLASQGKAYREFTSGKLGNSVRSFNVSLSHLDTLSNLADALHNGDSKLINKFSNYVAEQTGGAAPTNFDAAKKIVGDEIVKAIVGSGGGVHDREEAARVIASANSPAQLKGAIGTYQELMRGQLNGLQQQYEASTGRKDFDSFLSKHAREARGPQDSKDSGKSAHPPEVNDLLKKYGGH